MQSNPFGFETSARPCPDGQCEAASMCEYKVRDSVGPNEYGPGGSIINTNNWFNIQNDLISDPNYNELWKLRTTIWQNSQ